MEKLTYDDVRPLFEDIVGTDIINPDKDTLNVLGMDSLDALVVIVGIEKKYDVSIEGEEYNNNWTINRWLEEINNAIKYNGQSL